MQSYLLSVDQSTSGTKALIVDRTGRMIAGSSAQHGQYYPAPGWVEHDALEIYEHVLQCAESAMNKAGIGPRDLAALTLTNQRETAVMWDRNTGLPVCRAIVWQCQRTAAMCRQLQEEGLEPVVNSRTGLKLDPYFSAAKWRWILDHVELAQEKLASGDLLAGTIDSWLLWKLTDGAVHATDYTNASRTSLFNIYTLAWDGELCERFGVPQCLLPVAKPSDAVFGYTRAAGSLIDGTPIAGIIGDSQAALFGNHCLEEGMAKATYGTGTSVMMNIGPNPIRPENGVVQALAWGRGGTVTYALEAVIRTSGDSLRWVRDNLGLFETFEEMEIILGGIDDSEGVYLVPAFVGLGAPYWKPNARAAIMGMNRGSGKAHIIRAAMESMAYQVYDAVDLLQSTSGKMLRELRVDGGASGNSILMQFQADLLGANIRRSEAAELSAMGSAYMGGLAIGLWHSLQDLPVHCESHTFEPAMNSRDRDWLLNGWKQAVSSVIS